MLIVKIGGSVISDKNRKYNLSKQNLSAIAKELLTFWKEGREKFILVAGAGAVGHSLAKDYLMEPFNPMASAACSAKYDRYFDSLKEVLLDCELPVFAIRTSNFLYTNRGSIEGGTKIINNLVRNNMIPLLSADFCSDIKARLNMVSSDDLAAFFAKKMKARRVIMVTDVDGVKKRNGGTFKEIYKPVDIHEKKKRFDISGGIKRKVDVLLKLADGEMESVIVNGLKPGELTKALRGEDVGTKVRKRLFSRTVEE